MKIFKNYYFNAQSIKIITLITMFIDHFVGVFSNILPDYIFIIGNIMGSITFPIMAYFLVMGFYHTKNIRLYFMRLTIFWIISIIPFYLCHDSNVVGEIFEFTDIFNNIFFTLLVSLGQFTRNYTQTVKRAADNKRRYAPGEGSIPPVLLSGVSKGVPPLAHDFACKV